MLQLPGSNYIWVINYFIAYKGTSYIIRDFTVLYISVIDLNTANMDVYKLIYRPMHLILVSSGHRHHNILLKESQLPYSLFSTILISVVYSCDE